MSDGSRDGSSSRVEVDDRLRALLDALRVAEAHTPKAVLEATGEELGEILKGVLPGGVEYAKVLPWMP